MKSQSGLILGAVAALAAVPAMAMAPVVSVYDARGVEAQYGPSLKPIVIVERPKSKPRSSSLIDDKGQPLATTICIKLAPGVKCKVRVPTQ